MTEGEIEPTCAALLTAIKAQDEDGAAASAMKLLAGAISDAAFGEIRRQCEYKSAVSGGRTVTADRWYPSSKACSECGSVKPKLSLGTRIYRCDDCGSVKCRGRNAADNLEKVGRAPAEPAARAVNARGHRSSGRAKARGETAVNDPITQSVRRFARK
jgi:putative transposase